METRIREWVYARPQQADRSRAARLTDVLVISGSLLALGCWLVLLRWYSLLKYAATPAFSFDRIPGHFASRTLRYTALLLLALSLIYVANYWLIRRAAAVSRGIKLATVVMIVGSGMANILIYPVTAIDVFYYLAELKLAYRYHQNPYLAPFVPAFAADPFARFGWPLYVPLAYGPAWLLLSSPAAFIGGFDNLLRLLIAYKVFSFLLLLLGGLIVYRYHDDERSRWSGVYALLANPLIVFEAVGNAHNDIMMAVFLLAAVLALKRQSWLVLPLLAVAALIKVFAAALIPVFLVALAVRKWPRPKILVSALLALAVVGIAVAPFWANGRMLAGMQRGMAFANSLATGSLWSFTKEYLRQRQASEAALSAARLALGGLFVIAVLLLMWKSKSPVRVMADVLLLLYTLVGSIQPWYWIPVIALLALELDWVGFGYLAVASTIALLIYLVDVWARFDAGLSFPQRHLLGTLLLNLPIVGLLALDLWGRFQSSPLTD